MKLAGHCDGRTTKQSSEQAGLLRLARNGERHLAEGPLPPAAAGLAVVGAVLVIGRGGGRLGLMGAVADSALEAGGEVIGVIPDALVGTEVAHRGCTELHVVQTMHERKKAFTDLCDGFLTLPGGVGTMDELLTHQHPWIQSYFHGPRGRTALAAHGRTDS